MNKVLAYNDYFRNTDVNASGVMQRRCEKLQADALYNNYNNIKEVEGTAHMAVAEKNPVKDQVKEAVKPQDMLENARKICKQEMSWGRVLQKDKVSSFDRDAAPVAERVNDLPIAVGSVICSFLEAPTAVELFVKDRNMDCRNVADRIFATGGKVVDFTV